MTDSSQLPKFLERTGQSCSVLLCLVCLEYERIDHMKAEVSEGGEDGKRHVVDLDMRICTCREFQVSGNLASITFPSSMELGGGGHNRRFD